MTVAAGISSASTISSQPASFVEKLASFVEKLASFVEKLASFAIKSASFDADLTMSNGYNWLFLIILCLMPVGEIGFVRKKRPFRAQRSIFGVPDRAKRPSPFLKEYRVQPSEL